MPLSWNEIRNRAYVFVKEWEGESRERAEAQTFWNQFFDVFGISRRRVATFDEPAVKTAGEGGWIDLLWKGTLLVEHKSRGKSLDSAFKQATDYFPGLPDEALPRYIVVSDFARFRLYDLDEGAKIAAEFDLLDFPSNLEHFAFIAGYTRTEIVPQDPVNIRAAEQMAALHDKLKEVGYTGHSLEVYLVRLVFCLFAEDTGVFGHAGQFRDFLIEHTRADGSDLAGQLATLFEVLNQPEDTRLTTLPDHFAAFPYVNGRLFNERLPPAAFDSAMRMLLLGATKLDWGKISPAIFGSLFQGVMDAAQRRTLGAHYTSEENILKLITPLFLGALRSEFIKARKSRPALEQFHEKLGRLKFLDPACGCGNFLVIAYRELRLLEIEVLQALYPHQRELDIRNLVKVRVDHFYGVEIEEFPAQIAQVAMWLTEHQMNIRTGMAFGQYFVQLPLTRAASIVNNNALRLDWETVVPKSDLNYILGNPPFIGRQYRTAQQQEDMQRVFAENHGSGVLDYVCAWFKLAGVYIRGTDIRAAFVSTNSISQGELVSVAAREIYQKLGLKIHFAHRTFRWSNEARGKAAVHCVIIGFGVRDVPGKVIFDYETPDSAPTQVPVNHINAYLVQGPDVVVEKRREPICDVRPMAFGSMPNDGGHLILDEDERREILAKEPEIKPYIRLFLGSREFINGEKRWCLWFEGVSPSQIRAFKSVKKRIEKVREVREASRRSTTVDLAATSYLFGEIRQPSKRYIAVPEVSSERRQYIPIDFLPASVIASNKLYTVDRGTRYEFGILASLMHMSWVRHVAGRLKSDYQYSTGLVYNNFPWPAKATEAQRAKVELAAQAVLDARAKYPDSTLADLYDPLTMPKDLLKAHHELDKAVDRCYRPQPFPTELSRVEYLFSEYERLTAPMLPVTPRKRPRRRTTAS